MFRDLPDPHADGDGDLFEIRVGVRGHRRAAFANRHIISSLIEARFYFMQFCMM
jgi:hypothetical protein